MVRSKNISPVPCTGFFVVLAELQTVVKAEMRFSAATGTGRMDGFSRHGKLNVRRERGVKCISCDEGGLYELLLEAFIWSIDVTDSKVPRSVMIQLKSRDEQNPLN